MIGFLDCYSGISGDMLLGALVDSGWPIERLRAVVAALGLDADVQVSAEAVTRGPLRATLVHVDARHDQPHRTFGTIRGIVDGAALPEDVRARGLAVLRRITEVESRIHGVPVDEIELHEVGALDSIVDVIGGVAGLAELGLDEVYASAVPISPGEITAGHHGALPGPGPAALALLAEARAPTRPFGDGRELVTPTGAAMVATLARFEQPAMRLERVGYGAGGRELPWPNVLRIWIGSAITGGSTAITSDHVVLETSIDDMSPQLLAPVTERLFAAGALDVAISPLFMKKGRAGSLVTVIAAAALERQLADVLLRETTTLGVRVHDIRRHEAERRFASVDTPYGPVAVKLKVLDGLVVGANPEFESVRLRADACGVPVATVHAAAAAAALALVTAMQGATRDG